MYLPRTQLVMSRRYLPVNMRPNYQQQSQPQQGGGLGGLVGNAQQGLSIYNKYQSLAGGEQFSLQSLFGGGGGGSSSAAGATSSGGGSSALAGMGGWAALVAAIIGNEENSRKKGRRDENKSSRFIDQLSGAVLEQDMDHYGEKVGGFGGKIISTMGKMGNPEGIWKTIKNIF